MAKISDFVFITITRETRTLSQQGFGTALIVGDPAGWTDYEVRTYNGIDELLDDGFASTDEEYKAAAAAFMQSPRPEVIKVAKKSTWVAQQWTLTLSGDLITDNVITAKVNGVTVTHTFATDHLTSMNAFAAKLQALPEISTAVVSGPTNRIITLTSAEAGTPFEVTDAVITLGATQASVTLAISVPNNGIVEDLGNIVLEDDDWYGLILTTRDTDVILQAAAWVQTQYRILGTTTDDADTKDPSSTTDIGYVLQDLNYDRSFVCYNEDEDKYMEAAWIGRCLPEDPGSITWKFKGLTGQSASKLNTTERSAVLNKNVNLYTPVAGVEIMEEGTMAEGEFIDVIIGIDWLRARMAENIFGRMVNSKKIPYTDGGIAIIESQIRATLDNGIKKGLLQPNPDKYDGKPYLISVPKYSEISENDKGNRLLPDITWEATLAGAIHKVTIQGRVVL